MFPRVLAYSALALFVGVIVASAIRKTIEGRGADGGQNYLGMPVRAVDIVSVTAGFIAIALIAWIARWWQNRDLRTIAKLEAAIRKSAESNAPNKVL